MDTKKIGAYSAIALFIALLYLACSLAALHINFVEWHPIIRLAFIYGLFTLFSAKPKL